MNKSSLDWARENLILSLVLLSLLSLIGLAGVNQGGDPPGLIVFTTRKPADKPRPPQKRDYR